MHGNLRSNSCREQKRKTKVVRINRNSAKSASFSSGQIEQSKYTQIPLMDPASIEQKIGKRVQSAVCISQVKSDSTVIPIGDFNGCDNDEDDDDCGVVDGNADNKDKNSDNICIAIDETTKNEQSTKQFAYSNGCVASNVMNFISNCTNSNDDERDQSDSMLHDAFVAKYDNKNKSANHPTNGMLIHLNSNNNNNNNSNNNNNNSSNGIHIHSSVKNLNANVNSKAAHCNLSPTTGANVIKQKISLLRRVCKHTAKKRTTSNCSSPTSPCTDGPLYFDGNRSIKAVSV